MYEKGERRILVVDDDEGILSLLKNCMEGMGVSVDTARDGVEALRLWRTQTYGLVMTDVVYMYSGGIDLVEQIRSVDSEIPILVMTGYGEEVAKEAVAAGANHILLKPFHLFEVRNLVAEMLR